LSSGVEGTDEPGTVTVPAIAAKIWISRSGWWWRKQRRGELWCWTWTIRGVYVGSRMVIFFLSVFSGEISIGDG
jgi:hypothetical protein